MSTSEKERVILTRLLRHARLRGEPASRFSLAVECARTQTLGARVIGRLYLDTGEMTKENEVKKDGKPKKLRKCKNGL